MLPIERQEKIKKLIKLKKNMKITELSEILNVSEMTVHRDIKPLLEEKFIIKTFGGISLNEQTNNLTITQNDNHCIVCMRSIRKRLAYIMTLKNNKTEIACCAHCGLIRHEQLQDEIVQAITYDFLRETTVSALLMYYVIDTSLDIDCCQPQVLAFEHFNHAKKFVKGFGGSVHSFSEAKDIIKEHMQKTCTYLNK